MTSLAWSILSNFYRQAAAHSSDELRILVDAIRLAALNRVVASRFGYDYLNMKEGQLFFSALSYECQRNSISPRAVGKLAKTVIEDSTFEYHKSIQKISTIDFVDLLGRIHSLGSYRLPTSLQHASSQRYLGAFYTPQIIADYIVELTIGPMLRKHVSDVRKKGFPAVAELLSLCTIDPACGTGVFLLSALKAMQQAVRESMQILEKKGVSKYDYKEYLSDATLKVCGVDIDSSALEVADVSLRILESIGKTSLRTSHIGSTLKQGNSLITLDGFIQKSDNRHFFNDPESRTPFEWGKEFNEIFSREKSGFDSVVMNPPYERLKPNFAEYMREELLSGEREIHTNRFEEYKSHIRENTRYFRESNEFKLATGYSLNTYQLFIERALQISRLGGSIGFIVPSNILSDVSAQTLRREIFLRNVVNIIDDFPEASRVFPKVTQSASILVITKGGQTKLLKAGLNRTSVEDAIRKKRLKIKLERIIEIMGHSLVIPRVDAPGLAMLERMHKQPSLSSIDYLFARRGELDLTLNKEFISFKKSSSQLIRGSHITRYSLREVNRAGEFVKIGPFSRTLIGSERAEHFKMNRIACQQVSNMGQRWRIKFAPIKPLEILSNSCNYLVAIHPDSTRILDFLLGVLNSELLNWRFQISNSNNHVSIRELQSLPIVQPEDSQKILEKNIINDVQKLKEGITDVSSSVEACVFALYGFGVKEARQILRLRKTPSIDLKEILHELLLLEGERLSN